MRISVTTTSGVQGMCICRVPAALDNEDNSTPPFITCVTRDTAHAPRPSHADDTDTGTALTARLGSETQRKTATKSFKHTRKDTGRRFIAQTWMLASGTCGILTLH